MITKIVKVAFVLIVIFGLVASYIFYGLNRPQPAPTTENRFSGPEGTPSAQGPSGPPPSQ